MNMQNVCEYCTLSLFYKIKSISMCVAFMFACYIQSTHTEMKGNRNQIAVETWRANHRLNERMKKKKCAV